MNECIKQIEKILLINHYPIKTICKAIAVAKQKLLANNEPLTNIID